MAHKLYTGIHNKIDNANLITLMAVSNVFGRGFSHKRFELIMNELPDILVSNETYAQKVRAVENIRGLGEITAKLFVDKIEDFKGFLKDANLEDKLYENAVEINLQIQKDHPLFGKNIVLTGTRDKGVIDLIAKVGANMGANVSKNTFLVIAKSKTDETGKLLEAKKLGIHILTPEEFIIAYSV
jgi:NAD-dependent DNA ligase